MLAKEYNYECRIDPYPHGSGIWKKYAKKLCGTEQFVLVKGSYFTCSVSGDKVEIAHAGQNDLTSEVLRSAIPDSILHSRGEREYKRLIDDDGVVISITGGDMEPTGHGDKPGTRFVDGHGNIQVREDVSDDDGHNEGVDYVPATVNDGRVEEQPEGAEVPAIIAGGEVTHVTRVGEEEDRLGSVTRENKHGNRVHIRTDRTYPHNGKRYPVRIAYGHLQDPVNHPLSQDPGIRVGRSIERGDTIGYMGNTGESQGPHVDMLIYIDVNGEIIPLSPNIFLEPIETGEQQPIAIEGACISCKYSMPVHLDRD